MAREISVEKMTGDIVKIRQPTRLREKKCVYVILNRYYIFVYTNDYSNTPFYFIVTSSSALVG